jgi:hypothetical protein
VRLVVHHTLNLKLRSYPPTISHERHPDLVLRPQIARHSVNVVYDSTALPLELSTVARIRDPFVKAGKPDSQQKRRR